jgi:hypothetical protein
MFVDLTINLIVLRLLSLLIIAPIQRLAVAAAAVALGDPGPKYDGELTVDPLRHLDLFGSLTTIVFSIGWSKSVAIDPAKLKVGRAGVVVVILAAFAAVMLTAFVFHLLVTPVVTMLPFTTGITMSAFLDVAAEACLWFALLGMIPIPPLTAGLVLTAFGIRLPRQMEWILAAGLAVAVAAGVVSGLLGPTHTWVASWLLGSEPIRG